MSLISTACHPNFWPSVEPKILWLCSIDPEDQDFYVRNPPNLHLLTNDEYDIMGEYVDNQAFGDTKELQIHQCI